MWNPYFNLANPRVYSLVISAKYQYDDFIIKRLFIGWRGVSIPDEVATSRFIFSRCDQGDMTIFISSKQVCLLFYFFIHMLWLMVKLRKSADIFCFFMGKSEKCCFCWFNSMNMHIVQDGQNHAKSMKPSLSQLLTIIWLIEQFSPTSFNYIPPFSYSISLSKSLPQISQILKERNLWSSHDFINHVIWAFKGSDIIQWNESCFCSANPRHGLDTLHIESIYELHLSFPFRFVHDD